MSDNIKLSIEDMNLFYGNFHALHDINMHIPEKEITAFIGPSGCGKSTLLKSLNRMNDLVEGCRITGKVELDGELLAVIAAAAVQAYREDCGAENVLDDDIIVRSIRRRRRLR